MALVGTLTDDFASFTEGVKWTASGSTNAANVFSENGALRIQCGTAFEVDKLTSVTTYDFTNSGFYLNIKDWGNVAQPGASRQFYAFLDANNYFVFYSVGDQLNVASNVAASFTNTALGTINATSFNWIRIRNSGGNMLCDTSADGLTWTNRLSLATPFAITALSVILQGGTDPSDTLPNYFILDNFNVVETGPYEVAAASAAITASRSPALTFPSDWTPALNDVVVFFPSSTSTAVTPTAPATWVNPLGGTTDVEAAHEICCVYHLVTAGEVTAVTRTYTATNLYGATTTGNVVGCVIRGVDPAAVIDSTNTAFSTTTTITPHVLPSLTGSNLSTGSLVLSCVAKDGTGAYGTSPAGWGFMITSNTNQGKALLRNYALTTAGTNLAATNITPSAGDEYASITIALTALATAQNFTTTPTDAVGLTDALTKDIGRLPVDAVGITDSLTKDATRVATDAVGLTDSIVIQQDWVRSQDDPVGITDSLTKDLERTQTDAVGLTDSLVKDSGRTFTDAEGLTDVVVLQQDWSRTQTDPVGLTDTLSKDFSRIQTDPVGITDFVTVQQDWARSQTDAVGLTDSLTEDVGRTQTDAVGITDSVVKDAGKTQSDPVGVTDSIAIQQDWIRSQTDAVGVTDSATDDFGRIQSDPVGITDAVTKTQDWARSVNDAVGVTDSTTFAVDFPRTATDTGGFSDSATFSLGFNVASTDAVGVTDSLAVTADRVNSDAVGVTDSFTRTVGKEASDSVGITDSVAAVQDFVTSLDDDVELSDSATFIRIIPGAIAGLDSVGLLDALDNTQDWIRSETDSVGISDALASESGRIASDSVGITDDLVKAFERITSDSVGITDDLSKISGRIASDDVGITDALVNVFGRTASDSVGITDALIKVSDYQQSRNDQIGISDTAAFDIVGDNDVSVTDLLGLTDSLIVSQTFNVLATDPLGITDSFSSTINLGLSNNDSIGILDELDFVSTRELTRLDTIGISDSGTFIRTVSFVSLVNTDEVGLTDSAKFKFWPVLDPERTCSVLPSSRIVEVAPRGRVSQVSSISRTVEIS